MIRGAEAILAAGAIGAIAEPAYANPTLNVE